MLAQERKRLILEILSKCKFVEIDDLSNKIGVSEMTIRRDLLKLEQAGLLTRTYRGAVSSPSLFTSQPSFDEKEVLNSLEKRAIGAAAARLIQEGETIGLGAGTTCYQVARQLNPGLKITIVTNTVNIAMELTRYSNVQLIVTGGIQLLDSYALVEPFAVDIFQRIHINKLFLGATGVSLHPGITTQKLQEASLYQVMANAAQEVIIVADHSKLNLVTLAPILELERVTRLVTDPGSSPEYLDKIAQRGVDVIVSNMDFSGT